MTADELIEMVNQLNDRQFQILLLGIRYLTTHPEATTSEMTAVAVAEYAEGMRITAKELLGIVKQNRTINREKAGEYLTGELAEDTGKGHYGKH